MSWHRIALLCECVGTADRLSSGRCPLADTTFFPILAGSDLEMRKVAIFTNNVLEPSETFIYEQAKSLKNWTPVVVGFREVPRGLETPGIRREIVSIDQWRHLAKLRLLLDLSLPLLTERLEALSADLVHAHFATAAVDIWRSVKAARVPMIVTLHGFDINVRRDWWEDGRGGFRGRFYPRQLLKLAHDPAVRFVAVSEAIKQQAIRYGIPAGKIWVSYIGVDISRFVASDLAHLRKPQILFVGRMVEKKAPLLMISIFAELRKRVPNASLVMAGSGPLLGRARALANLLDVPVEFLGMCSPQDVLAQLHKARVLCLPSVTAENGDAEGFGMVLLEAQACGVPVVSSARGGATEGLLHGETGFRCAEHDKNEFVARIQEILCNDSLAAAMSRRASAFVADMFDIKKCTRRLEQIYDMAIVQ